MRQSIGLVVLAAVLGLGACGGEPQGAGGLTEDESRQLNEAAAMLDEATDDLAAAEETVAAEQSASENSAAPR